jgi:hypothetical protein
MWYKKMEKKKLGLLAREGNQAFQFAEGVKIPSFSKLKNLMVV